MFSSNTSSAAGDANFVEDVFSTYLYTGNGSTQTITNGIDLAGKGGLLWVKCRNVAASHRLYDTGRGANQYLNSASTDATNLTDTGQSFTSTGFQFASNDGTVNDSGRDYASWTFRKQPKFFDVVTYTGNGTTQNIAHNLGSVPGCVITKRLDAAAAGVGWNVFHRGLTSGNLIYLNSSNAQSSSGAANYYGNNSATVDPASSQFTVGNAADINASGGTYVAYLFAHDAGGFGLTGTDNVISCGSFTVSSGTGSTDVNLGYEPQWLLAKPSTDPGFGTNWNLYDTMRGWVNTTTAGNVNKRLNPNLSQQETSDKSFQPTATGFTMLNSEVYPGTSITYIYIAIRRGPMKVPTTGTSVFAPITRTGTGADATISSSPVTPDIVISKFRSGSAGAIAPGWYDRLRGAGAVLFSSTTQQEGSFSNSLSAFLNKSYTVGPDGSTAAINDSAQNYVNYALTRAPGFADEVCYTGTGVARTVTHNLAAVPELMIVKSRSGSIFDWIVYAAPLTATSSLRLNLTDASSTSVLPWNNTAPTSAVFTVNFWSNVNDSGQTYVAYLFATCPGVSKVGGYTGTGTTLQIDCGFTAGSRFVLIKRTDSTGGWYFWDSARGIVAGNDPYLFLNDSAAEVTGTDYVDTFSSGFEISSTAPAAINASGGTFIFLAIA